MNTKQCKLFACQIKIWFRPVTTSARLLALTSAWFNHLKQVVSTMKTPPVKSIATSLLVSIAILTSTGTAFASSSLSSQNHVQQTEARFANTCGASYRTLKGDTIASIASKCGVDTSVVRAANGGRTKVRPGKTLRFKETPAPPTPQPRVVLPRVQRPPAKATQKPPVDRQDNSLPTPTPAPVTD